MRRNEPAIPYDASGTVVTVGTFDGVHRGHREVLDRVTARASQSGRRSVLVTFHPHPLRIVRPEMAPPLLTTADEKKEFLAESGLDYAVFIPFTPTLQRYSARRFVREILLARMHMRELVIGYDHGFGRDREGGADTMRTLADELGFAVDVVGPIRTGDAAVSSTRIRGALTAGDVVAAARGLGRPYSIRGPVVRGAGRGRRLGFPTANIAITDPEKLLPLEGVYAVYGWVRRARLPGLLHLGPRPTFGGSRPTVELHLLDFSGDLYGQEMKIDLCARLRGIETFRSAEDLIAQMQKDETTGRAYLGGEFDGAACTSG